MAERLLDLDEVGSRTVKLGGVQYTIRQQRQAVLERVLKFAHTDVQAPEGDDRAFAEMLFQNWDASLPFFALILGCEEPAAQEECVAHLKANLTIPAALTIYETWWEINRIEDFFGRGGRPMLPPYIMRLLTDETAQATEQPVVTN